MNARGRCALTALWLLGWMAGDVAAQSLLVFTAMKDEAVHEFWRVTLQGEQIGAFDNLSRRLDALAPLAGADEGPIAVSADGAFFGFHSERFDGLAQGWAAVTIVDSAFERAEVVRDSLGRLIHAEGLIQVLARAEAIVYTGSDDGGAHSRDLFVLHRRASGWGMPLNLTAGSPYDFNTHPRLAPDGSRILFDAAPSSFPSVAIGEVELSGANLRFPITAGQLPGGVAVHAACYEPNGDIVFEGDAGGERIWRLSAGGQTPGLVNAEYGNDNSPVVLADGRIASLSLPGQWHHVKIMDRDGRNGFMLTDSGAFFTEVDDIGLSACPVATLAHTRGARGSRVAANAGPLVSLANGRLEVKPMGGSADLSIRLVDIRGRTLLQRRLSAAEALTVSTRQLPAGLYLLSLTQRGVFRTVRVNIAPER